MSEDADALADAVARHMLSREGTGATWGIAIEDVRAGYARVRMTVRDDMLNGHRTIHGGMIFALADTAFAYACNSRNEASVAASASIVFLAPARAGDVLIAEAREEASVGRSGAYSVVVRTSGGAPVAQFQGQSRTIGGPVLSPSSEENPND